MSLLFRIVFSFVGVCFVNSLYIENFSNKKHQQCGTEVSTNEIHHNPWVAFLLYYRRDMRVGLRCAGTLVSDSHVLTAAHCVKGPDFDSLKVLLGEYDVKSRIDCDDVICGDLPVTIDVEKVIIHPKHMMFYNDIAVLKLKTLVTFTDFIRPICLVSKYEVNENLMFTASGWGEIKPGQYSRYKKHIPLPYREKNECKKAYSHTIMPDSIICAGGEPGLDTCAGDSGGPLMLKKDGKVELWGITNAGNPTCGLEGFPGVYLKVFDYLEWLEEVMI